MASIATLTMNPALDMSTEVDEIVPNDKLRAARPRYEPGGGGLNVSRALARLGSDSVAIYTAGGQTGRALRELLEAEGVEADPVEIEGTSNESVHILERRSGDQFRFTMPGPELVEAEWKACLSELAGLDPAPGYVVASGSLPPGVPDDLHARLCSVVAELGGRLVVDTSGEALRHAVGAGVYLVKPNMRELRSIVGEDTKDADGAEQAARKLVDDTPTHAVVVSLGSEGALLVAEDGTVRRYPAPDVPVRSRIGAGDSMVGGIVHGLATGMDLAQAVALGVATGAAAVMTPGTELCRREDAERIFAEMRGQSSAG